MRDTFSHALLTEIAKVLLLMVLLLSAEYARQPADETAGPRTLSLSERLD
jgi:hypothetical protein